jgi:muconolactone D-isomerase
MEFLVQMQINLPPDHDAEDAARIRGAEAARAAELLDAGAIVRIWRVPGRTANVGIWEAADATELHDLLASLPLAPWMDITVSPLATHYVEAQRSAR